MSDTPGADFTPEEVTEYWRKRWDAGRTGWKDAELTKPFEANMRLVLEAAGRGADLAALRGKSVFVPLCGDTYALKFFHDLGCDVVGVDLAEAALLKAQREWFAGESFGKTARPDVCDGCQEYALQGAHGGATRLFAGDIFAVVEKCYSGTVFDVVYDRASLMAIHPTLRPRYVAMMKQVFRRPSAATAWLPVMFVDLALRPTQSRAAGPPFHIPERLIEIYPECEGYRSTTIVSEDKELIAALERGGDVPAGKKSFTLRNCAVWIF